MSFRNLSLRHLSVYSFTNFHSLCIYVKEVVSLHLEYRILVFS